MCTSPASFCCCLVQYVLFLLRDHPALLWTVVLDAIMENGEQYCKSTILYPVILPMVSEGLVGNLARR